MYVHNTQRHPGLERSRVHLGCPSLAYGYYVVRIYVLFVLVTSCCYCVLCLACMLLVTSCIDYMLRIYWLHVIHHSMA